MKSLLTLIIATAFISTAALAQTRYVTTTFTVPSVVTAATTTNVAQTLDVRKSETVSLQATFSYTGAGADATTIILEKSIDGTRWATDAQGRVSWIMAGNGATAVSYATNVAMGGFGYLRLYSIQNAHATLDATNIVVKAAHKQSVN